ncbi:MAG: lysylphosphatidylglycerol synthase domain-containing protein [Niveispirillum sp.]|uniref:lysylphosphatidylglycerol synthase domain-containing protein n=1 Tax=Niveispirillum sp. TaxID=1917217 RepID=UPI003BA7DA41
MSLTPDPESPASETAPASDGMSRRQKAFLGIGTILFLGVLLVFAVRHVMAEVDFGEVIAYLEALPLSKLIKAIALTALAFWLLTLYDLSALIYLKKKVPYRTTAFAAGCGYAISNNVGWAVISGAGVRLRAYGKAGLSPADVAKVVVFSTTTFTLGLTFTGAVGMIVGPHPVSVLLKIPEIAVQAAGALMLLGLLAICVITAVTHKPVKIWRWTIQLPSWGGVVSQITISSAELVVTAGILWMLLPVNVDVPFVSFVALFCAALIVAIFSHVPGGLGVFESIILLGMADHDAASSILGALLAYRFIYYVLPLAVAGLSIAIWEIRHHTGRFGRAADRLRGRGE